VKMFDADKPRMTALLYVEKTVIPERHGQTDGRTESLYQYGASVCLRAIKIGQYFPQLCSNKKGSIFDSQCICLCYRRIKRSK